MACWPAPEGKRVHDGFCADAERGRPSVLQIAGSAPYVPFGAPRHASEVRRSGLAFRAPFEDLARRPSANQCPVLRRSATAPPASLVAIAANVLGGMIACPDRGSETSVSSVVVRPAVGRPLPIIATIPHGGTFVPERFAKDLMVPVAHLWSDWYTRELYEFLPSLGITTIAAGWSRFVADVNRQPDRPLFAPFWSGIVASTTTDGEALYRNEPGEAELAERVRSAWEPFHARVDSVIASTLRRSRRLLVLDLHSFGMPLQADIVLGDRHGQTLSPAAAAAIDGAVAGFEVAWNDPFPGGWTVQRLGHRSEVDAVQLELSQRMYLPSEDIDARRHPPRLGPEKLAGTQQRLSEFISTLARHLETPIDR